MKASVVVCTHNPRVDIFRRVVAALASQTLPAAHWEVVIVDNGSSPPVSVTPSPGLPPLRSVVEPQPGLTPARIRGIRESRGDLIVFVDDDNLLAPDFLETALRIAASFPQIGVFGGRISGDFETTPPQWLMPFLPHLALVEFPRDEWSSLADDRAVLPCGAGLCVRRSAAETWARLVESDPRRLALDRVGDKTLACGDTDLVLTCLDHGYGSGRFTALHLTHVIPARRLDYAYHRRLARDIGYSYGRLLALRGDTSRGRRMIAAVKTALAWSGVKHRGKARVLDVEYHRGYWHGLCSR